MPKIDTSNANVARVLRDTATVIDILNETARTPSSAPPRMRALADALDAPSAVTWKERGKAASVAYRLALVDLPWRSEAEYTKHLSSLAAALRAAFPELAPSDD